MPCCLNFSFIFLKIHALLGRTDSDSATNRYRDTVHYNDPVVFYCLVTVKHYIVYIKDTNTKYTIY